MSLPSVRDHTDAVIAALVAGSLSVGDGEAPNGVDPPYAVVYSIPGGDSAGTIEAPDDDAMLLYQVTCVGESREQAEWVSDKVLGLLLPGLDVDGRHIPRVWLQSHAGVRRDDGVTPAVFVATPRFRIWTTAEEGS